MKLSQWHNGKVKPVHAGVYQIKRQGDAIKIMFSFFNGKEWCGWQRIESFKNGDYPNESSFIISGQDRQWRGIVKDKK